MPSTGAELSKFNISDYICTDLIVDTTKYDPSLLNNNNTPTTATPSDITDV